MLYPSNKNKSPSAFGDGVAMLILSKPAVIALLFCSFAGLLFSQANMQFLHSIVSPFESGWSVAIKGGGDLNGDGYDDIVLVGRPHGSGPSRKDVYIYLGGSSFSSTPDHIIVDPAYPGPYYGFGSAISYNADINGDGYCDLVISEPRYGVDNWGRVLVYYGGPTFDTTPDLILDGLDYGFITYGLNFGANINISGDFNGDGFNDLVISSEHGNLCHYGQVNIFFGGPTLDTTSDWQFVGEMEEEFGITLAVGDLNGDGYSDLVVSARTSPESGYQVLKLFLGGDQFDSEHDASFTVHTPHMYLLPLMSEDFNHDSYDDLIFLCGNEFQMCWGSAVADLEFELWHTSSPTNLRSIYTARFNGSTYLCYGTPQMQSFNFYRWQEQEGLILEYVIKENYDPHAANQLSYFLGDINGDGHNDILLSNRAETPVLFKVFTTEFDDSVDDEVIPAQIYLTASPNPFCDTAKLCYELKSRGKTTLSVYNLKGQLVARIRDSYLGKEQYSAVWDGKDSLGRKLPCGVYLIKLSVDNKPVSSKKITLIY